jgi:hypothetical protein
MYAALSSEIRAWVDDPSLCSKPIVASYRSNGGTSTSYPTNSPPSSPVVGTTYLTGESPVDDWDGHPGRYATWHGSESDLPWTFDKIDDGTLVAVYAHAIENIRAWDGSKWINGHEYPVATININMEQGSTVYFFGQIGGLPDWAIAPNLTDYRARVIAPT